MGRRQGHQPGSARSGGLRVGYRRLLPAAGVPGALEGCDKATLAELAEDYWLTGTAYMLPNAAIDSKPNFIKARFTRADLQKRLAAIEPHNAREYLEQAREDAETTIRLAGADSPYGKIAERLLGEIRRELENLD